MEGVLFDCGVAFGVTALGLCSACLISCDPSKLDAQSFSSFAFLCCVRFFDWVVESVAVISARAHCPGERRSVLKEKDLPVAVESTP